MMRDDIYNPPPARTVIEGYKCECGGEIVEAPCTGKYLLEKFPYADYVTRCTVVDCPPKEATHLYLYLPGPSELLALPVQIGGTRDGTDNWSWNGSLDKPTVRPSVLTKGHDYRCHSFINDGIVRFLDDCTHEHKGIKKGLLPIEDYIYL